MRYLIKKLLKKFKIRDYAATNWKQIISENKEEFELIKKKAEGKKIVITTSAGGLLFCSHFESLLAFALTYYGAKVEILLCDKVLPACMMATSKIIEETKFQKEGVKSICSSCLDSGKFAFDGLDLKLHYFSNFIKKKEILDCRNKIKNISYSDLSKFKEDDINIGEHSLAGALRYYAVGSLDNEQYKENTLRKFTEAGYLTKKVIENFLKENSDTDIIISNHAIYVPQGIINDVGKKFKIRTISYTTNYIKNSFVFSHKDSYHHTLKDEPSTEWEGIVFNKIKENKLINYLNSRKYGTYDWGYYFKKPAFKIDKILKNKGIDIKKPIILLTPNIIWDANLIYKDNIFSNQLEWIFKTFEFFKNKNLQLIIRSHPGEVNADRVSKQQVKNEILKRYKKIPSNIFLIGPEENISTYSIADYSNVILIYASKIGVELSPVGKNVIVAGESYVKNKGITYDPKSQKEYFDLLEKLPFKDKLSESRLLRAKKYAYHFWFRRTIVPLSVEERLNQWPLFGINKNIFYNLKENKDFPLKEICNSIIQNKPFIYDELDNNKIKKI